MIVTLLAALLLLSQPAPPISADPAATAPATTATATSSPGGGDTVPPLEI